MDCPPGPLYHKERNTANTDRRIVRGCTGCRGPQGVVHPSAARSAKPTFFSMSSKNRFAFLPFSLAAKPRLPLGLLSCHRTHLSLPLSQRIQHLDTWTKDSNNSNAKTTLDVDTDGSFHAAGPCLTQTGRPRAGRQARDIGLKRVRRRPKRRRSYPILSYPIVSPGSAPAKTYLWYKKEKRPGQPGAKKQSAVALPRHDLLRLPSPPALTWP